MSHASHIGGMVFSKSISCVLVRILTFNDFREDCSTVSAWPAIGTGRFDIQLYSIDTALTS